MVYVIALLRKCSIAKIPDVLNNRTFARYCQIGKTYVVTRLDTPHSVTGSKVGRCRNKHPDLQKTGVCGAAVAHYMLYVINSSVYKSSGWILSGRSIAIVKVPAVGGGAAGTKS